MKEYRKSIELDPDTSYSFVEMGPIPELPSWHEQSNPSRYPFPTEKAAFTFAHSHKALHPNREVAVATPDGERFQI